MGIDGTEEPKVQDMQSPLEAADALEDFKISSAKVEKHDKKSKGSKESKKGSKVKSAKWGRKKPKLVRRNLRGLQVQGWILLLQRPSS